MKIGINLLNFILRLPAGRQGTRLRLLKFKQSVRLSSRRSLAQKFAIIREANYHKLY